MRSRLFPVGLASLALAGFVLAPPPRSGSVLPWSAAALAQQTAPSTQDAPIVLADPEAVIRAQLAAMAVANWEQAFGYATPGVQSQFGTPQRFAAMVEGGFSFMIDPASTQLIRVSEKDAGVLIEAIFISRSQSVHRVLYHLQRGGEQDWRIAGVLPGTSGDLAA